MSSSWFAQPETQRLDLSDGQWLLVKRRLNHGERRAALARMSVQSADGSLAVNRLAVSDQTVVSYLLDWSLVDDNGKPVVIREQQPAIVQNALDALRTERFDEIREAIDQHVQAVAAEDVRSPFGSNKSEVTLQSVAT